MGRDRLAPLIAVASRSFSADPLLRSALQEAFPNCRFNSAGLRLEGETLRTFLEGAAGAIVGVEPIDGCLIDRLPDLRVLSKYGVGLDTVDVERLAERGVTLAWTPGTNSGAVAELALLHMLAVLRRLPEALDRVRCREWAPVTGRMLAGKTVGLVGVGHVGRALARLLEPFGCTVLGYDLAPGDAPGIDFVTLHTLLSTSDVVSIHVPLSPATRHLIGEAQLALMKPTAILVNTSRGEVVDQDALLRRLAEGRLAGAGLDVLAVEPPHDWAIADQRGVFITPHLAGSSAESNLAMGMAAIQGLVDNRARLET